MKKSALMGLVAVIQIACTGWAWASFMNYQGRLTDTNGIPVSGSVTISVRLYTNVVGGTAVYTEAMGAVAVANGIFSVDWGNSAGCESTLSSYTNLWLGVTIDGAEMAPRRVLGSVPRSIVANTVKGQTLFVDDLTGRVGIGTNNPASTLTVKGVIESTSGGVKFPDGTVQTTAVTVQTNTLLIGWWNVSQYVNGNGIVTSPSLLTRVTDASGSHCLELPNGAKILRMYGQAYDDSSGMYCYVWVNLQSIGTNGTTSIGSFSTTDAYNGGATNISLTFVSNNIVNTASQAYFVNAGALNSSYNNSPPANPQGVKYIYIDYVK